MTDTDDDLDPAWLTKLAGDLKELERTDPKVAEAKRKYDQVAKRLLQLPLPPAFKLLDETPLLPADPTEAHALLASRTEGLEFRIQMGEGRVTEVDVARWTTVRLQDFKQGEPFKHEAAFCALVVALEALPGPAARGFIEQMAASQATELTLLPKIAQECLKARIEAKLDPAPVELQLVGQGTCQCGASYIVVRQDGKDATKHKQPVCEFFDKTGRVSLNRKEQRALEARRK